MEFKLRDWDICDYESICKYGNNKKIADNLRDGFPYPYTIEDAKNYVEMCIGNDTNDNILKTIEIDGNACGSIGLFIKSDVYRKSAELGYWLGEEYWGMGIMSRAIRQICDYTFANHDIVRIYAEPYAENMASRRALEKSGFELEAILKSSIYKNGRIMDGCIYALIK